MMHTDTSTRSLVGPLPVPAEHLPLPRGDMQVTVYVDGFPHAVTPADLYLLIGRALAAKLHEPFEMAIRFEAAPAGT